MEVRLLVQLNRTSAAILNIRTVAASQVSNELVIFHSSVDISNCNRCHIPIDN